MVEGDGFEPPNPEGADLQSAAFSHFATPPHISENGAGDRSRTHDLLITSQLLYQLSYTGKYLKWWLRTESNRRHKDFQSFALPTELLSLHKMAVPTGIEPAISCVTGRHVNRYTTGPLCIAGTGFEPATFGL